MPELSNARRIMVDNQIRTFDVTDREVLSAFDSVPREAFLPAGERGLAYTDRRVELSGASGPRSLLPPLVLARLIQALQPQAGESALDVLGAHGYSAAILAAIGLKTSAIESDPLLASGAVPALAQAGAQVEVLGCDGGISAVVGCKVASKTYDVILINGATETEPSGFFPLLAEGGRLGCILRRGATGQAAVYVKANGVVSPRFAFDAQAPVLPGFEKAKTFVF